MQQRPSTSSAQQHSPKRKPLDVIPSNDLPIYDPRCNVGRRSSRVSNLKLLIHTIPLVVLLCIFILWWLSYPVNLVIRDGRIAEIHRVELPQDLHNTRVDITILAAVTSPTASVPQNFNETNSHPVSSI